MRPRERTTFQRRSASWSTDFNLTVPGQNMGLSEYVTRTRIRGCQVCINPCPLRPNRAPRPKSGSHSQVQQPFIPKKSRIADILLTIPGRRESMLLKYAGVSTATGRGKPITPAHKVMQNLPTSCNCWEPRIKCKKSAITHPNTAEKEAS